MIELASDEGELIPSAVPTFVHNEASRVAPSLCLAKSDQSQTEIERSFGSYTLRYAVGPAHIWEIFPEYRNNFFGSVRRYTRNGAVHLIMNLGSTIFGDRLVDNKLFLPSKRVLPGRDMGATWAEFSLDGPLPEEFDYLESVRPSTITDLVGHDIYFLESLSFFGKDRDVFLGCASLTPEEFFESTNIRALVEERSRPHHPGLPVHTPFVPDAFSAALILKRSERGFNDVLVGRAMAAAALSSGASGRIISQLYFTEGGWGSSHRADEDWHRPYADHRLRGSTIARTNSHVFQSVAALLQTTSPSKFAAAKEDFRLLALDTIEDSRRSGIPPLQVAQIWMAIERLMPFRTETTVQLAVSLSSFFERCRRVDQFNFIKHSYGIRSKIVHGYSFERNQNLYLQVEFLSDLFRRLFLSSLGAKNSDELRTNLLNHTLSGVEAPFDASFPPEAHASATEDDKGG